VELPDVARRPTLDGLTECVPEIGVLGAATVTRPPGGVDAELHQVREPAKLICAPSPYCLEEYETGPD